jgi:hypothetical protein
VVPLVLLARLARKTGTVCTLCAARTAHALRLRAEITAGMGMRLQLTVEGHAARAEIAKLVALAVIASAESVTRCWAFVLHHRVQMACRTGMRHVSTAADHAVLARMVIPATRGLIVCQEYAVATALAPLQHAATMCRTVRKLASMVAHPAAVGCAPSIPLVIRTWTARRPLARQSLGNACQIQHAWACVAEIAPRAMLGRNAAAIATV